MPRLWKVLSGDYVSDIKGTPIGSYEEASALFACSLSRDRSSCRKNKHDSLAHLKRTKWRLVNLRDMGSNVSRHSGKGLSGRRAQSSGSLYRILGPRVGRVLNPCGNGGVRHKDRNKFSGSLPNHLDEKQISSEDNSSESLYYPCSNYEEIYLHAKAKKNEVLRQGSQDLGIGDQGYGSEWSPEDEPLHSRSRESTFRRHSKVRRNSEVTFITMDNIFETKLEKGSRGLGLSVTGGIDTTDQHPGLIRIKRIFPHQPAWECGTLELGDIILEVNGTSLTGLTNHEALEVLRTTPSNVVLKICRPPGDIFSYAQQKGSEPPPPPRRDPNRNLVLSSQCGNYNTLPLPSSEPLGEFDLTLQKVNGSLGFTLRKEDESILGHYVRALVREPAISDGRIRPGDKIVSVNGVDISPMSHEEAVAFLRKCGNEVKFRLYRDPAQTPIVALSPTESHKIFRPKPVLRKEAMDMLSDLAVKKLSPSDSSSSSSKSRLRSTSPGSSPRRRKLTKTPVVQTTLQPEAPSAFKVERDASGDLEGDSSVFLDEYDLDVKEDKSDPSSMPPISTSTSEFNYKNPIYQSAVLPNKPETGSGKEKLLEQDPLGQTFPDSGGTQGLLKWKGIVFKNEEGNGKVEERSDKTEKVLTVELNRGWNSRLGFSLQSSEYGTLISAIYPDSVTAKDGRLRSGDKVIMINDEPTEGMTTSDVIDLLRKIRGTIAITVIRGKEVES